MDEVVYKSVKGNPITDSIKVAEVFGKDHKNLIRSIRNLLGSAQNCAHLKWFYQSTYLDAQGKQRPMYIMNRDGFSLLAMGLTGEKAMQFKIGFIEQFNRMEQTIEKSSFQLPQTMSEALRLAADQADEIDRQRMLLEKQAPKVIFADAVATSTRSCLISELAKVLKQNGIETGQNKLFEWMRSNGYLCQKGWYYNQPTQKSMDLGLFEIKQTTITKPDGEILVTTTTKVTGKGQQYFINKFLGHEKRENNNPVRGLPAF